MKIQLAVISLSIFSGALPAATIQPVGAELPESVTGLYIPPTRSDDPLAAAGASVYKFDAEQGDWKTIYTLPWNDGNILAIEGYAKSSKVLYVVHDAGVSRTGDGGVEWIESIPPGYTASENPVISVNPHERRHAVLVAGGQAWETTDYGLVWTPVNPSVFPALTAGFLPVSEGEQPRLLLVSAEELHLLSGEPLMQTRAWQTPERVRGMAIHAREPMAFIHLDSGWTIAGNFDRPQLASSATVKVDANHTVPSLGGSSSVWTANGLNLSLVSLHPDFGKRQKVSSAEGEISALSRHPDDQDGLYLLSGKQVYQMEDGFQGLDPQYLLPSPEDPGPVTWPALREEVTPATVTLPVSSASESGMDTETAIRELMASQPSFAHVMQKALRHAMGNTPDFDKWNKQSKKRHWFPELRIESGIRDRNVDDYIIVEEVDQFGIPQRSRDLNLPDRIRGLGYAAVVLEWDLYDLIFDDEQVSIQRERRYTYEQRREFIEQLSEWYHQRIEKLAEYKGIFGDPSPARSGRLLIEIQALDELLNALCGETVFP